MSIQFKKVTMTPAKAKSHLAKTEKAGFSNRGVASGIVKRYTGDMEKGHWQADTAETIKITDQGVVIDGQHRLNAIIAAGVAVKLWVATGVPLEMFQYIDQGKPRGLEDIMVIENWDKPKILSVTAKMLWRQEKGGDPYMHAGGFNESDGNIYNWVLTCQPSLATEWARAKLTIGKCYSGNNKSTPESLLFYLWYMWGKDDEDTRDLFFDYLSSPLAIPSHNAMVMCKQQVDKLNLQRLTKSFTSPNMRHADYKEALLKCYTYAWHCIEQGRRVNTLSGFKSGMTKWAA